jgi:hypothetical protein
VWPYDLDKSSHRRLTASQTRKLLVQIERHLNAKLHSQDSSQTLHFFDREALRIEPNLTSVGRTIVHRPNRQTEAIQLGLQERERHDLATLNVELIAQFAQLRMADGPEVNAAPTDSRARPNVAAQYLMLPLYEARLPQTVLNSKTRAGSGSEERPIS